jgi:hypothetical protein
VKKLEGDEHINAQQDQGGDPERSRDGALQNDILMRQIMRVAVFIFVFKDNVFEGYWSGGLVRWLGDHQRYFCTGQLTLRQSQPVLKTAFLIGEDFFHPMNPLALDHDGQSGIIELFSLGIVDGAGQGQKVRRPRVGLFCRPAGSGCRKEEHNQPTAKTGPFDTLALSYRWIRLSCFL